MHAMEGYAAVRSNELTEHGEIYKTKPWEKKIGDMVKVIAQVLFK